MKTASEAGRLTLKSPVGSLDTHSTTVNFTYTVFISFVVV